jgi:hypothetical protein
MNPNLQGSVDILRHQVKSNKAGFFGALLILFAGGTLLWALVSAILAADPQTRAAVIAALAATTVALVTNYKQREKDLQLKMREQKIPAYENALSLFRGIMISTMGNEPTNEQEIKKKYYEVNHALLVAGSQGVLAEWIAYYQFVSTPPSDGDKVEMNAWVWDMRLALARVIRAIRQDLGHKDPSVSDDALADLFFPLQQDAKVELVNSALQSLERRIGGSIS